MSARDDEVLSLVTGKSMIKPKLRQEPVRSAAMTTSHFELRVRELTSLGFAHDKGREATKTTHRATHVSRNS